ncbi:MAG: hypothetical protein IPJ34_02895 [Myxococcales bacterium]|nr:hypothetical protein [Myxococcales bacterium]
MIIKCGTHGGRTAAVVCGHMLPAKDHAVGFVENSSEPDDLQAWCDACERLFLREGEMTDEFKEFNQMTVVCDDCYAELRARHSKLERE